MKRVVSPLLFFILLVSACAPTTQPTIPALSPTATFTVTPERTSIPKPSPTHTPTSIPTVFWANSYGGAMEDFGFSTQPTSDGGYLVAGYTNSFGAGATDAWVLKLDAEGGVAWEKAFGGPEADLLFPGIQTAEGGHLVAGQTISFGPGFVDLWVLKLDAQGGVTWQKAYGGDNYEHAVSVQQARDGGYIVVGSTDSFGAGLLDVWALKLNKDGDMEWQYTYGGAEDEQANSVKQTSDGGYVLAGVTQSFGAGARDVWVLKLNADGLVEWQKTYGGPENETAHSVDLTSDGGFIVVGNTESYGAGAEDFWVLKLDADGMVAWQKAYGGSRSETANFVHATSDGRFILAGNTNSFGEGGEDVWAMALNPDGTILWQKTYGGESGDETATHITETNDGGAILSGRTSSFGAGEGDVWVLKLLPDGAVPPLGEDTAVKPVDTDAIPQDTAVEAVPTNAAAVDTPATVTDTQAKREQQAP